jgi:dTDP-4-amino-4,6-dideoxygalactose transaminase
MVDDVEAFINFMKEKGVTASQVHKRNDVHSCVSEYLCDLPNLTAIEGHYVCIPVGWWVTDKEVSWIVESIKEYDTQ